ncbi:MAG TPA: hypothetical protein VGD91_24515 [Trebonia sp.]
MSETIAAWLRSARGARLDRARYEQDFGVSLGRADGADSWKLERRQSYSEAGFPSWEAFVAGDWDGALRLYEAERPAISAFQQELRRHRSHFYRVRVVAEPVSPYVQWEMHCLRLRAECGENIRVIDHREVSGFESDGPLPELVSLCGHVLYHTVYDESGRPDGAVSYRDAELVRRYEDFARALYQAGEGIESYFGRKIAGLPPPHRDRSGTGQEQSGV